ncbi:MAG: quercetin 2,3-dioxygenase [Actinobacteria bacterium]|nr:quercetin 2,3-dioxygenase [Actinomycetota bacterium]
MAETQDTSRELIVRGGERTGYWFLNDYVEMLATGEDTEGRYTLFEVNGPPGDEPPLHLHHNDDEAFLVLEGELEVWIGSTHTTLRPGDYALLPKGVPHIYRVSSAEPARWLVLLAPAGFDNFLRAVSRPAEEARIPDPPAPPTPADAERLGALAAESGMDILGPPGARP